MPSIFRPHSTIGNYKLVKHDINQPCTNQVRELDRMLPRFGPVYGEDTEAIKALKGEAWQLIEDNTPGEESDSISGVYHSAVGQIYEEARDFYEAQALQGLDSSRFREMMVLDGCLFLQVTLWILGGSDLLGYPSNHVFFNNRKAKDRSRWVKAMFFAGNQIPCAVLNQLLKQTFFQNVIVKGIERKKWVKPPSDDLPKTVLYQLVLMPEITGKKAEHYFGQKPSDLFHAFYCSFLGSKAYFHIEDFGPEDSDDDLDLEASTEDPDSNDRLPSATEVAQSGIELKRAKGGLRQLSFKVLLSTVCRLYVPPLILDSCTEQFLQDLKDYEINIKRNSRDREVAAYLCCMRDLIQTPKDVLILESKGIVQFRNKADKNKLPRMLRRLCHSEEIPLARGLRIARLMTKEYANPRQQFLIYVSIYLALIQTIFTMYSVFAPGK